jgi:hypothetical protein
MMMQQSFNIEQQNFSIQSLKDTVTTVKSSARLSPCSKCSLGRADRLTQ